MKNLEAYVEEAIQNIREDRATTKSLLMDAMVYVKKNEEHHKTTGPVLAKYLETLQRSNEQLVKIASLLKKEKERGVELSDFDKESIFDSIKEEKET